MNIFRNIKKYLTFFKYNIELILKLNPSDKKIAETGENFWSGNKRLPHPLDLDLNDNLCFQFIKSFSCLLASCLDIDVSKIDISNNIKKICSSIILESPKKSKYNSKLYYEEKIVEIKNEIKNFLLNKNEIINFKPINYDKDSTNIYQIEFISNCSNLRAKNYNIEQADKFKINVIAGKMIPGIITSTASIAGLLALQLYVICQNKDYKHFMTGTIDLSDNTLALGIPLLKFNKLKNKSYDYQIILEKIYKNPIFLIFTNNIVKYILLVLFLKYIIHLLIKYFI